jgi:peroxiredoxin
VLDAVSKRYPNSPLVEKLKKDVELMESRISVLQLVEERSYPELKGSDIYGKEHTLSSLEGNVILVDFWSAESGVSNITNADLKDIYKMYEPKGFRIYQVSADTSKATWVAAVVDQHLPWVSVCDLKGAASPLISAYNVRKLPSNFLIDRDGNIIAKNLYGRALEDKLAEIFK